MPKTSHLARRIAAADTWVLRATTWGAMLLAAVGVWAVSARVAQLLTASEIQIFGMQIANAETPAFAGKSAHIAAASYESVTITVEGLTGTARGFLIAEAMASGLLGIGLCIVVAILGRRILARRPFVRSATWAVGSAAILVMASGAGVQYFAAIARAEVVEFLGTRLVTAGDMGAGPYEGLSGFAMSFDLSPFGWGLALAIIAAAFQLGERLQRDTEGLV